MENYVERGHAFLKSRGMRLTLRVVPLALAAVSAASAAPTMNTPSFTFASTNPCSGGGSISNATLQGVQANSNQGIILSGAATISGTVGVGSTCLVLDWYGTGSGTLDSGTLPVIYNFLFNAGSGSVTINNWTLTFRINGTVPAGNNSGSGGTVTTFSCNSACSNTVPTTNQTINAPVGAFTSYEARLLVNLNFTGTTSLTVNVPPDSSIHINAPVASVPPPAPAPSGVPALSTTMLMALGTALLALGSGYAWRRNTNPF